MGRTFGFIIAAVGFWLMFSLPIRDPNSDDRGGTMTTTASNHSDQQPLLGTNGEAASAGDASQSARGSVSFGRLGKAQDQRAQAARSRAIEAEPATSILRKLEAEVDNATAVAVGHRPALVPATIVAVASGQARSAEFAELIPSPVAVSWRAADALAPRTLSLLPSKGPHPTQRLPDSVGSGDPVLIANQEFAAARPLAAVAPGLPTTTIRPPRIVDAVRRDLASTKPDRALESGQVTGSRGGSASAVAKGAGTQSGTINQAQPKPANTLPKKVVALPAARHVTIASANATSPADDVIAGAKGSKAKSDSETSSLNDKPLAAMSLATSGSKPETVKRLAHAAVAPPSLRHALMTTPVRPAQVYAPPAYLGRVIVRYAPPPPPAFFVPASSNPQRAKFRAEGVWDAIRKSSM